jgi:hypothetical protein
MNPGDYEAAQDKEKIYSRITESKKGIQWP